MSSATLKKVFHGQHLSGPSRFSVFSNVVIKSFPRLLKYVRWESKDTGGKSLPKTLYNSDLNLDLLGSDWLTGWYIYLSTTYSDAQAVISCTPFWNQRLGNFYEDVWLYDGRFVLLENVYKFQCVNKTYVLWDHLKKKNILSIAFNLDFAKPSV